MLRLNKQVAGVNPQYTEKILQFGGGNFLRAFADYNIQRLNDEHQFDASVIVVKPTPRGSYDEWTTQDCLFNVIIEGIENGKNISKNKLVSCVSRVINPFVEWQSYLKTAEDKNIKIIISNTTEAGIEFKDSDNDKNKIADTFPGKLTQWLYHRFIHQQEGCFIIPCELIENNGETLKQNILKYITLWNLENDFACWINEKNYFYNTLVDSIVSGFPKNKADGFYAEKKYTDSLLVHREVYEAWLLQGDEEIKKVFPFHLLKGGGIKLLKDIAPHRKLKVSILNGAHTAMAVTGYLKGLHTVSNVMQDSEMTHFIEHLLKDEIAVSLKNDFAEKDILIFIDRTLDRYKNPYIQHKLLDISLNSTAKFKTRLLPAFKYYLKEKNQLPPLIVKVMAALIQFYSGVLNGQPIPIKDNQQILDFFDQQWKSYNNKKISQQVFVKNIIENKNVFGEDLSAINGLAEKISTVIKN